jgi:hypothetical protein
VVNAGYVAIATKSSKDYLQDIQTIPIDKILNLANEAFKDTVLSAPRSASMQQEKMEGLLAKIDLTPLKNVGVSDPHLQGPATYANLAQQDTSRSIG